MMSSRSSRRGKKTHTLSDSLVSSLNPSPCLLPQIFTTPKNTVKQHSGLSAGGAGLRASEEDILEEGRKAVASIQVCSEG